MTLLNLSSPHTTSGNRTFDVMRDLLLALLPGIVLMTGYYGWGTLINIVLAVIMGALMEIAVALLRKRPIMLYLSDGSLIVTAVLLALTVPPYSPWWALLIGMIFAIIIAKHLYGGLGYNPFNPAMVGYVVLLISFPLQMTFWPLPQALLTGEPLSWLDALQLTFDISHFSHYLPDGYSGATALDIVKQNNSLTLEQLYREQPLLAPGHWTALGSEGVSLAYLIGGGFLLYRKVVTWHAPLAMLLTLSVCALLGYDSGSSASKGSVGFHLLSGATMLGAFFIITDPVSGATSNLGRCIFGAGVGLITYLIRAFGNYPDGVAFAVLFMNLAAPFIDYYTRPRSYGQPKPKLRKLT